MMEYYTAVKIEIICLYPERELAHTQCLIKKFHKN